MAISALLRRAALARLALSSMSVESSPASRAVFLSYASQDAEAARRICESLRAGGVDVWFDADGGLEHGDEWDAKIRGQIKECVLFIPLISANTQAREEGYFRLEWELAAERAMSIASGVPFILPIVIDATREPDALVPDRFRKVQWTRLPGGVVPPDVLARLLKLWSHRIGLVSHEDKRAAATTGSAASSSASPAPVKSSAFIAVVAVMLVALGGWWLLRETAPKPAPKVTVGEKPAPLPVPVLSAEHDKSLVVLPLENLSPDPENAFFTDGMHEEIIQTLARLGGLKVLSRSTALALKESRQSLGEIGRRLDVVYALTGNVQRGGKDIRIALELRRTTDESVVWQRRFDRKFVDGFAVQDEIAAEVAKVLQVHTSTGHYAGAKFMTKNAEAYELFLKARDLPATKGPSKATFDEQIELCQHAVTLDPEFMSAASLLSVAYSYRVNGASSAAERAELATQAKRWADRASALMPGGAGDGALAVYYSRVEPDPERGLGYAQNETRALPNDPNAHNRVGAALARFGRSREALVAYNRALALDPFHVRALYNRVGCAARLRDVPVFEDAAAKSIENGGRNVNRAEIDEWRYRLTGQLPASLKSYDADPITQASLLWLGLRFEEALTLTEHPLANTPITWQFDFLRLRADVADALGRSNIVREAAQEMREIAEAKAPRAGISGGELQAIKLWALAIGGRREESLSVARQAVETFSAPGQTQLRWSAEEELAAVHARFGDKTECVEILGRLLKVPSGITVPDLKLGARWRKVRDDPAFQALLVDPKNSAPL
jgi:TolB-like protein